MKLRYYLRGLGIGMLVAALVLVLSGDTNAKMSDEAVKRRAAELGMVEKDKSVLGDVGSSKEAENGTVNIAEPSSGEAYGVLQDEAAADDAGAASPDGEEKQNADEAAGGESGTLADVQGADGTANGEPGSGTVAGEAGDGSGTAVQAQGDGNGELSDAEKALADEIEARADEVAGRADEVAQGAVSGKAVPFEIVQGDTSITVARRAKEAGLVASAADFDFFLCQNGYSRKLAIGSYELTEGMSEEEIADILTKSAR